MLARKIWISSLLALSTVASGELGGVAFAQDLVIPSDSAPLSTEGGAVDSLTTPVPSPAGTQLVETILAPQAMRLKPLPGKFDPPVLTSLTATADTTLVAAAGDDHAIRLIDQVTQHELQVLQGHADWIQSVEFTPDEQSIISGANDGQVWIWEKSKQWQGRLLMQRTKAITTLSISPSGQLLAVAGFHDTIAILNLTSGEIRELDCPCHDQRAISFSKDEQSLAAGGRDGTIRVWDLASGDLTCEKKIHNDRIRAIGFTRDGTIVTTAGEDRQLVQFDLLTKLEHARFAITGSKILSLAMLSDHLIALGGSDNSIRLVDLIESAECSRLSGHEGSVSILRATNDYIVSASFDTSIRVWNIDKVLQSSESAPIPITRLPTWDDGASGVRR